MKLLAIDTATEACSAALYVEGEITERYQLAPREHNRIILPMIQELLHIAGYRLSDLDAIAFGCGPGSFTGVRIATGVVQGLALGLDVPVIPISTLAAMAHEAFNESSSVRAHASIDARMGEVYWASYQRSGIDDVILLGEERVLPPDQVNAEVTSLDIGIGSGWSTYRSTLEDRLNIHGMTILDDRFPRARSIAGLGATAFKAGVGYRPEEVEPLYLRNDVAQKPKPKGA